MDTLTPERRSDVMRRVKQKDTRPELCVRRVAHAMGFRFRLHRKDLPGRPDLVFPKLRVCLFVHGCFWHRHVGCRFATTPKSNEKFWLSKFDRNVERDERNASDLEALGWRVVVVWECETRDAETLFQRLKRELTERMTEGSK
ncbi:very short patch repair endonuclease [Burkholderia sp. SG-MS1]|uniref:very short patch repair endonuclease n=1 Tax=Paraburkholderia sp. SG-MS1 TaxID=2023741 RepID=UPI001446DAD2|nr:DNA mismatch endonuclease Vsr [Paraburkholderia sp. SG-MS1]NKJ47361.1 very short patch repair endonuclease [Paraburkholderia sp. SG-MS1]